MTSPWYVTQWKKAELLLPDNMRRSDEAGRDSLLGLPLYSFTAESNVSRVDIYEDSPSKNFIFSLHAQDGTLSDVGGTDLLLSSFADGPATLDAEITYQLDLKLSDAFARARDPEDIRKGIVGAQALSGFTLAYVDPDTKTRISFFMQLLHSDARNIRFNYNTCFRHDANMEILSVINEPDETVLPFAAMAGRPIRMKFSLNRHVCEIWRQVFTCPTAAGTETEPLILPPAASDFKNWKITSMYVGAETYSGDFRSTSKNKTVAGTAGLTMQISNLIVTRDASKPFSSTMCRGAN
jgi:hypothetical protein